MQAAPKGIDVSKWQGNVAWAKVKATGVEFAYVKATEGTTYKNPCFTQQYTGSYAVGLIRGSYHFALPDKSSGAAQATFFAENGGGWSADGMTLPGALDIEYNPYGDKKDYGLSQSAMVSWIKDFCDTYQALTGRYPVIYTTTDWWKTYTGNSAAFGSTSPLWIARYASSVGKLPAGWSHHTIWQNLNDASPNPGDSNIFNGNSTALKRLALG
ncbi:putative N,O-diacetyl muramidase [Auriculariales sp. MPI-PUGE-AT-0066]|nr:putative N,O-diacetyl muramidase [Auriculariales sp. MPI-PUGE-AT-0066]